MQRIKLKNGAVIAAIVLLLAGCTTSSPASVAGLKPVFGNSLPGAVGKTLEDQEKIDDTVVGGCSSGIYSRGSCARHTRASDARRKELSGGG